MAEKRSSDFASFGYDSNVRLTSQTPTNAPTQTWTFDAADRVTHLGTTALRASTYDFQYNAASWTTTITSTVNNGPPTVQTIGQDALGHMTAGQSGNWTYDGKDHIATSCSSCCGAVPHIPRLRGVARARLNGL